MKKIFITLFLLSSVSVSCAMGPSSSDEPSWNLIRNDFGFNIGQFNNTKRGLLNSLTGYREPDVVEQGIKALYQFQNNCAEKRKQYVSQEVRMQLIKNRREVLLDGAGQKVYAEVCQLLKDTGSQMRAVAKIARASAKQRVLTAEDILMRFKYVHSNKNLRQGLNEEINTATENYVRASQNKEIVAQYFSLPKEVRQVYS